MARSYTRPPGVTVTEVTSKSVNPLIATPDLLCLVGPASGTITATEAITLNGTTASTLTKVQSDGVMNSASISAVWDPDALRAQSEHPAYTTNSGYFTGSYTFDSNNHTITRKTSVTTNTLSANITNTATTIGLTSASSFSSSGTIVIDNEQITYTGKSGNNLTGCVRGANGTTAASHASAATVDQGYVIADNRTVYVTYTYAPANYYYPYAASSANFSDIENRFGTAFKADGVTVNSPLTLAAQIAIDNGASDFILQPLFYTPDSDDQMIHRYQPSVQQAILDTTWGNTFKALRGTENIGVIVPVIGQAQSYPYGSSTDYQGNAAAATYATGTITQSSTTVTGIGTTFTTAMVGKTLVYADGSTTTITSYTNATAIEVQGTKSISTGQTYTILLTELNDATVLSVFRKLKQEIGYAELNNDQLMIAIFGEDSTASVRGDAILDYATISDLTNHLTSLQSIQYAPTGKYYNENLVFIAETFFTRPSQTGGGVSAKLGGQYAASAIGGMVSSRKISTFLTRKAISGFDDVVDTRTKTEKTTASGLGFFVIERTKDGTIQVRHSLTTDNTSVATAELAVIRAKHHMINSIRQTIDTQIVGQVVADDNAPIVIQQVIAGTLRTLQENGELVGFDSVQARTVSIDPTEIEVRFNYRPAFPVNYINIKFSVDLTSGLTSLVTADQTNLGV